MVFPIALDLRCDTPGEEGSQYHILRYPRESLNGGSQMGALSLKVPKGHTCAQLQTSVHELQRMALSPHLRAPMWTFPNQSHGKHRQCDRGVGVYLALLLGSRQFVHHPLEKYLLWTGSLLWWWYMVDVPLSFCIMVTRKEANFLLAVQACHLTSGLSSLQLLGASRSRICKENASIVSKKVPKVTVGKRELRCKHKCFLRKQKRCIRRVCDVRPRKVCGLASWTWVHTGGLHATARFYEGFCRSCPAMGFRWRMGP